MSSVNRRTFVQTTIGVGAACAAGMQLRECRAEDADRGSKMRLGLVTYLWGKDMDLPTLLTSCQKSGLLGVELRTEHAHKVEPSLSPKARREVQKRFADSPVTLVGYGSNAQYHESDPEKVKYNIELTKEYVRLMHDCGGTGVKVKPNGFPPDVPREKTIEQIGMALNEVAAYAEGYGQQIRVEVHGQGTSELPVIKAIFDVADHPNATVCWNSNDEDLRGNGLRHNFHLVKARFGHTVHIRELNVGDYPYEQLMKLFVEMDYDGWILLEARTKPADKIAAMTEQRKVFEEMIRS